MGVIKVAENTITSVQLFFFSIRREEEEIFDDQENDGYLETATCYVPNSLNEQVSIDKVQVIDACETILQFVVFLLWVIPRCPNFICRRFGTLGLFHRRRSCEQEESFFLFTRPTKTEQTECSEKSAYKIQRPGNHPKERTQHSGQGEGLKSRIIPLLFQHYYTSLVNA